jgi:hypothetical protein
MTSALLEGSMTEGRAVTEAEAAVDLSGSARTKDATDISSKGLLPQLIEVLHALTQGQELLSSKIRKAELEYARVPVVDRCPQAEASAIGITPAFVGARPNASRGIRPEPSIDGGDLGAGPINGDGNVPRPGPSIASSEAHVNGTMPGSERLSDPLAASVMPTGYPSERAARTDRLDSARPDDTTTELLNRNYNFFDELDARLADLKGPTDLSDDS